MLGHRISVALSSNFFSPIINLNPRQPQKRGARRPQLFSRGATMASTLMASSSTPTTTTPHFPRRRSPSPKSIRAQIDGHQTPLRLPRFLTLPATALLAATAFPAMSAEIEKAALFDFNLTLPAIAAEFLLLMVALDKIYFTPLGNFMDARDAEIRAQLGGVKDTSEEVRQLEEQAAAVLKAARAEISAALNQMKKETSAEMEASFADGKRKVEEELGKALAALEMQKEETLKALDDQINVLSQEIVAKVLPPA